MPPTTPPEESEESANARFARLTTAFLAEYYQAHPTQATAMGLHTYDDRLDSFYRFAFRDELQSLRAYLHALDALPLTELDSDNRIDARLARSFVQKALFELETIRWHERRPGQYLDTIFNGLFLLLIRDFAPPEARAHSLLGRLRAVPNALQEARDNLQYAPRLFTELAIESALAGDALFAETIPAFAATLDAEGLRTAIEESSARARTALAEFARFLSEILLPNSVDSFALGEVYFDHYLRVAHMMTGERDTCKGLLHIGQETLDATLEELDALAEQIAPGRGWEAIVAELKTQHPMAENLQTAYAQEMERARAFVVERDLMTLPAAETLRMMPTPAFARHLLPYAAYMPPAPLEARQDGAFWVTPIAESATPEEREIQMQGHSLFNIPIIALHEAYPGHHLQMSRASEVESPFRNHFANSNLFIEGWALYCEDMMWEEGFYTDPRVRLMQLKATLWRACRVLIDVRLHTEQMTFDEAVQFLQTTARIEPAHALAEVKRYALTPTQPMSYIIGKRAIVALRNEVQRRQGARFDLKRFHDLLLGYGSMPPVLIREAMLSVT